MYPEEYPQAFFFRVIDGRTLEIEQYLQPLNPADDVAFFIAKPLTKFSPIIFGRPRNEQVLPAPIYNAKNNIAYGSLPLLLFAQSNTKVYTDKVIMAPPWRDQRAAGNSRIRFVSLTDTDVLAECEALGWSRMSYACFVSRPGNSGSPMWDDQWNLYGMDVRGRGGREGETDELAYYPASTLDRLWSEIKQKYGI
jgi:hypothetical protein